MPVLQDLADEIFLEIFSQLPCADIAHICLVSRQFRALGEIALYRTPALIVTYQPNPPLELFIQTVLTRPELTRNVRNLFVELQDTRDWLLDSIADTSRFSAAAEYLGLPTTIQMPTSPLLLLLNLLPNLHGIHLRRIDGNELDHFIEEQVCQTEPRNLPNWLHNLRHVRYSWAEATNGLNWNMLLALFLLPLIKSIDVYMEVEFTPQLHTGPLSSVTQLTLRSGRISALSLEFILCVPCALTHFTLVDCEILAHALALGVALRPLRGTLKLLCVGLCDYCDMGPEVLPDGSPNTLGGFSDWPVLESVRCSLTLLLGRGMEGAIGGLAEVLPVGVREVAIEADRYWPSEELADVIEELMGQKEMCGLDNLAVITVGRKVWGEAERVRVACQDVGVKLMLSPMWC